MCEIKKNELPDVGTKGTPGQICAFADRWSYKSPKNYYLGETKATK